MKGLVVKLSTSFVPGNGFYFKKALRTFPLNIKGFIDRGVEYGIVVVSIKYQDEYFENLRAAEKGFKVAFV